MPNLYAHCVLFIPELCGIAQRYHKFAFYISGEKNSGKIGKIPLSLENFHLPVHNHTDICISYHITHTKNSSLKKIGRPQNPNSCPWGSFQNSWVGMLATRLTR